MTMKIRIIRNVKTLRESNKTHICRGNPERKSLFKNVFVRTCLLILSTDFQSSCCDNYVLHSAKKICNLSPFRRFENICKNSLSDTRKHL